MLPTSGFEDSINCSHKSVIFLFFTCPSTTYICRQGNILPSLTASTSTNCRRSLNNGGNKLFRINNLATQVDLRIDNRTEKYRLSNNKLRIHSCKCSRVGQALALYRYDKHQTDNTLVLYIYIVASMSGTEMTLQ